MEEKDLDVKVNEQLPWQFSTLGLVLGFFIGMIPFVIALVGNHQFKSGYDTSELKLVYNICLIIIAILLGFLLLVMLFSLFAFLALIAAV